MAESRSSIPAEYKWDLSELFESTEAFEEAFRRTACQIKEFPSFRETMCLSGSNLLKTLTAYNGIHRSLSVLFEYAERNSDVDLSDNAFQSIAARVRLLYNDFQSASFFFGPQLVKIPERALRNWYLNEPELKSYRRFIDGFRRYRKHTLPDRQEKILADLSNAL
ncbi:MAG: hypothetical protein ILO68_00525, partial [Clostridia bacterium]|nr:hypothetical protein [Clostridia bacterium]